MLGDIQQSEYAGYDAAYKAGYAAGLEAEDISPQTDDEGIKEAAVQPISLYLDALNLTEVLLAGHGGAVCVARTTAGSFYAGFHKGVRGRERARKASGEAEREAIREAIERYIREYGSE